MNNRRKPKKIFRTLTKYDIKNINDIYQMHPWKHTNSKKVQGSEDYFLHPYVPKSNP